MAASHYDRLFRHIFSTLEAKADLARNVLPSRYLEKIHLESLQSEDESFIDEELKEHFTDILMSFELKEEKKEEGKGEHSVPDGQSQCSRLYLYLLVDHKSRPHRRAALQLLRYVSTIYVKILRDRQARNKNLPPDQRQPPPTMMPEVLPVVFYHGSEEWNSPLETSRLIQPVSDGEANHIPHFKPPDAWASKQSARPASLLRPHLRRDTGRGEETAGARKTRLITDYFGSFYRH